MNNELNSFQQGDLLIYQTEDGKTKIDMSPHPEAQTTGVIEKLE